MDLGILARDYKTCVANTVNDIRPTYSPKLLRWLPVALFCIAAYFPLFMHLDVEPVKTFDESLFALRAYNMAYHGEYLYNFGDLYGPSATSTKPPFFTAIQALSFRILGYNELALRLPVALTVFAMMGIMLWFSQRLDHQWKYGLLSAMVLLTAWGFVHVHMSRTGEHDAPLACFNMMGLMAFYQYLDSELKDRRWLWGLLGCLLAGTLTKSVAGLFFAPAMVLYALYKKQFIALLKSRNTYLALGIFLLIIIGHYLYRESQYPGFIKSVWGGEAGGHFSKTRHGHSFPFIWYAERLYRIRFTPWMIFVPLGGILFFLPKNRNWRDWGVLLLLAASTCLVIISNSQTKLTWYDASLFPPLAMIVGFALYQLHQGIIELLQIRHTGWLYAFTAVFVFAFFFNPYKAVFTKNYFPTYIDYPGERAGLMIKQVARNHPELTKYTLFYRGYTGHNLFYQLVYNDTKGYEITQKHAFEDIIPGESIMTCDPSAVKYIQEHFEHEVISKFKEYCYFFRLGELKPVADQPKND